MNRKETSPFRLVRAGIALIALLGAAAAGPAAAQSSQPLLSASDITYLGAFRVPASDLGTSTFRYGGRGLTTHTDGNGKLTIFMGAHIQNDGQIGQIEVPSPSSFVKSTNWESLPMAKVLQNPANVVEGRLSSAGDTYNGMHNDGLLVYNNRLIVGVAQEYGSTQVASHGVSGLTLSQSGDFKGFYTMNASAPPRALGGPMTVIPSEWRAAFGGPALTGNCCLSVIGATSSGPSATVFNPDDVGNVTPIPGKTVLFYPLSAPACGSQGCEATKNDIFNLTSRVRGMAFPPGTRTVLFIGGHGTGSYCYGTSDECKDQFLPGTKGPHAQPYRYQIWAYDANDLVAVKNGSKATSAPKPYGVWPLSELTGVAVAVDVMGAGYDPNTGMLFIAQHYGEQPRIDVYKVAQGSAPVRPNAPSSVSVE